MAMQSRENMDAGGFSSISSINFYNRDTRFVPGNSEGLDSSYVVPHHIIQ